MKNALAIAFGAGVAGCLLIGSWIALTVMIVVLVVLPPSWDPAIRFKEWTMEKRRK